MATLISPNGMMREVAPANGENFTLRELHAFVGGYIEMITLSITDGARDVVFVNEDGIGQGLAENPMASALVAAWAPGVMAPCGIVGSALRCRVLHAGEDNERVY